MVMADRLGQKSAKSVCYPCHGIVPQARLFADCLQVILNPEIETTDYADDTDGQVMPEDRPVLWRALGATVTLTHWVNGGGGE